MKLKLNLHGASTAEDQKPATAPELRGDGIFVRCCLVERLVPLRVTHPRHSPVRFLSRRFLSRPRHSPVRFLVPQLSGTVHLAYDPGQDISKSTTQLRLETEHYLPSAKRQARRSHGDARSRQTPSSSRSGVTLFDLISGGFLEPGENILSCTYQGVTETATLTARGTIQWDEEEFSNPTAWSIKFKRQINHTKLGDDGWKSIVYNNDQVLAHYRSEFVDDPLAGSGKSVATRLRRRR